MGAGDDGGGYLLLQPPRVPVPRILQLEIHPTYLPSLHLPLGRQMSQASVVTHILSVLSSDLGGRGGLDLMLLCGLIKYIEDRRYDGHFSVETLRIFCEGVQEVYDHP